MQVNCQSWHGVVRNMTVSLSGETSCEIAEARVLGSCHIEWSSQIFLQRAFLMMILNVVGDDGVRTSLTMIRLVMGEFFD
jgi:hypothetical protein